MIGITHALSTFVVTQAPSNSSLPALLGVVAAIAGVVAVLAVLNGRRLGTQLVALHKDLEQLKEQQKSLAEQERKLNKALDDKRDDVAALKQELAAQKKKTHQVQEEAKTLRTELASQREVFDRAQSARPAFADAPKPAAAPAPAAKAAEPEKKVTSGVSLGELQKQVEDLTRDKNRLHEALDATQAALNTARIDLKKTRKKMDDYRRIDAVTQGKLAALEDRVNYLGRQYYDAVTEIAVLKGEVPRVPTPEERAALAARNTPRPGDAEHAESPEEAAPEAAAEAAPEAPAAQEDGDTSAEAQANPA